MHRLGSRTGHVTRAKPSSAAAESLCSGRPAQPVVAPEGPQSEIQALALSLQQRSRLRPQPDKIQRDRKSEECIAKHSSNEQFHLSLRLWAQQFRLRGFWDLKPTSRDQEPGLRKHTIA